MATARPLRPCAYPGCPTRVLNGRCERHTPRKDTWTTLYGREWPRTRLSFLTRHPRCALCPKLALIADHYPRGIRRLIRDRDPHPNADWNLRPLCHSCHGKETARREPAGWAQR